MPRGSRATDYRTRTRAETEKSRSRELPATTFGTASWTAARRSRVI